MKTSLQGIAKKAARDWKHRFQNLYGMLNYSTMAECWLVLNKKAATEVDGVSALE
jgi:hypothetical protein